MLLDLEADFGANLASIEEVMAVHDALLEGVPRTIANGADGLSDEKLASAFRSILTLETFTPRRGALDAAIASGRLNLLRDPNLRSALTGWGHYVVEAQEEIEWAAPARDEFTELIMLDSKGDRWTSVELRALLNRVRRDPELQRPLRIKAELTREGRADFIALRDETLRVLELIGGG